MGSLWGCTIPRAKSRVKKKKKGLRRSYLKRMGSRGNVREGGTVVQKKGPNKQAPKKPLPKSTRESKSWEGATNPEKAMKKKW